MAIGPISSLPPIGAPTSPRTTAGPGFGEAVANALQAVSTAEETAGAAATDAATGGSTQVHEVMVAMTKAELSMGLLVQTRNRALDAYQEIMRMPV